MNIDHGRMSRALDAPVETLPQCAVDDENAEMHRTSDGSGC